MNSTLPNFLPAPAGPSRPPATPGGFPSDSAGEYPAEAPADFSTLMPAVTAAPAVAVPATGPAAAGQLPVVTVAIPGRRFTSAQISNQPVPEGLAGGEISSVWSRSDLAADGPQPAAGSPWLPAAALPEMATPSEVPQEIREQAVAFMASLLQTLQPEAPAPGLPGQAATSSPPSDLTSEKPLSVSIGTGAESTAVPVPAASDPGRAVSDFAHQSGRRSQAEHAATSDATRLDSTSSPGEPAWVVAEDGALEFTIPEPPVTGEKSDAADPVEFQAELELAGQPVVRVESGGYSASTAREKIAAEIRRQKGAMNPAADPRERIFEFAGDKEVTATSPLAGISIAKTESTMPAAAIEESRAVRRPQDAMVLPGRAEFQMTQAPAERIAAPATGLVEQNFAGRAVDTVTGLMEAQFTASMQKAGTVHLHLKFGGEDLSVRVEMRGGAVHTDFRTDSAPLRAALEREWQAVVASSPEQMQRYAEPVFSPGSSNSSPFSAQSDARQQQQQAQPDAQHRAPRESFSDHPAFNRRSLVSESFVPEPAAPRVASFLPTSVRLSALA